MDNEEILWDQIFQNHRQPPKEVSAALLEAGQQLYGLYATFLAGGFTEDQALSICAKLLCERMKENDE